MVKSIQEILKEISPSLHLSAKETLENYNHIDLTEDEVYEAIALAKQKKIDKLNKQMVLEKESQNRKLLVESQWSFEQTESFMLWRANDLFGGKSELDENNKIIFDLLCYYFSNDIKFCSFSENIGIKNPSLDKGIFIAGNFGVGKTWLMSLFRKNQRQVFHLHNAKKIANIFESDGEEGVDTFITPPKNAANDASVFFHKVSGLCIDDLGTEDIKTHYGNRKNVVGDLIELRYSKGHTGILLHATTNFTVKQIEEFYGGRITSRMREIFNWVVIDGKDRRK